MVSKSFARYAPWITGIACALYIYSWTQGITYEAWVPLIWCFSCFVNDVYNYLQDKQT